MSPSQEDPNAFGSEPLFSAELLAYLPPDHPRAGARALPIEALGDMPFLVLRRGFLTRDMFDHACRRAHIRPRIVLESDSPHALVAMVEAGHGVAILSSSAANGIRSNPPVAVTLEGKPIHRPVSAIWNLERHRPASLPAFVACLQDSARATPRLGRVAATTPSASSPPEACKARRSSNGYGRGPSKRKRSR
jgi:DNA-binding transcriptional LysR family regulator